jgi:hypothetical protein
MSLLDRLSPDVQSVCISYLSHSDYFSISSSSHAQHRIAQMATSHPCSVNLYNGLYPKHDSRSESLPLVELPRSLRCLRIVTLALHDTRLPIACVAGLSKTNARSGSRDGGGDSSHRSGDDTMKPKTEVGWLDSLQGVWLNPDADDTDWSVMTRLSALTSVDLSSREKMWSPLWSGGVQFRELVQSIAIGVPQLRYLNLRAAVRGSDYRMLSVCSNLEVLDLHECGQPHGRSETMEPIRMPHSLPHLRALWLPTSRWAWQLPQHAYPILRELRFKKRTRPYEGNRLQTGLADMIAITTTAETNRALDTGYPDLNATSSGSMLQWLSIDHYDWLTIRDLREICDVSRLPQLQMLELGTSHSDVSSLHTARLRDFLAAFTGHKVAPVTDEMILSWATSDTTISSLDMATPSPKSAFIKFSARKSPLASTAFQH